MNERTLHVAVIPDTVRSPVALVHLTGTEIDDLALLHWLHHPEQTWSLGYRPEAQTPINVRATLLARASASTAFIAGPAVLAGVGHDPGQLVDITHDLLTSLHLDRFN